MEPADMTREQLVEQLLTADYGGKEFKRQCLVALLHDQGALSSLTGDRSSISDQIMDAAHQVDPGWSGKKLRNIEPVNLSEADIAILSSKGKNRHG